MTPRLDIADVDIELATYEDFGNASTIKMYFPILDYWEISAHQVQKHWLLSHESDVSLIF